MLDDPRTAGLVEFLSIQATAESRTVDGEEIRWWVSPGLQFNVIADNVNAVFQRGLQKFRNCFYWYWIVYPNLAKLF